MSKYSKGLFSALAFVLLMGCSSVLVGQVNLIAPDVEVIEGDRQVEVFWMDAEPESLTYLREPVLGTVAFPWRGNAGVSSAGFYLGACDWTYNVVVSLVIDAWRLSWREVINWETGAQRNMELAISDLDAYYDLSDGMQIKIEGAGLFEPDMDGWSGPDPSFGGIYYGGDQSYPDSVVLFTFTCTSGGELTAVGGEVAFGWESIQRRPEGPGDLIRSGSFTVNQAGAPAEVYKALRVTCPAGTYVSGESFDIGVRIPFVSGDRFSLVAETFEGYLVLRRSIEQRPGQYMVISNISKCDSFEFFQDDEGNPDPGGERDFIDRGISEVQPGVTPNPNQPTVLNGFPYRYTVVTYDVSGIHEQVLSPINWQLVYPSVPPASSTRDVYVVPNPYVREAGWEVTESKISFINVPDGTVIRIYDATGGYVNTIYPNKYDYDESEQQGSVDWDLKNSGGTKVVSGIYIYRIESRHGEKTGRFIIVR